MTKKELIINYSNDEIIEAYLDNYKNSKDSVKMRKHSLNYFFDEKYFGFSKKKGHISNISKSDLYKYFNYLKELNLTLRTKKNKWNIINSFIQVCMEFYDDFVIKVPKKTIDWGPNHKDSNSNKNIIATEEELKKILDYLFEQNFKYYLIFRMFYETGMRKSELRNAEYQNINLDMRYIWVKGKTGRQIYFFSKDYAKYVAIYLETRKQLKVDVQYLFLTRKFSKYSDRSFNTVLKGSKTKDKNGKPVEFKGVLERLGIQKDITCHTFRRTLNTLRKKKLDCSLEDRKILLGHKTNDVNTDSYTIFDFQEKLALYDKYYPYF